MVPITTLVPLLSSFQLFKSNTQYFFLSLPPCPYLDSLVWPPKKEWHGIHLFEQSYLDPQFQILLFHYESWNVTGELVMDDTVRAGGCPHLPLCLWYRTPAASQTLSPKLCWILAQIGAATAKEQETYRPKVPWEVRNGKLCHEQGDSPDRASLPSRTPFPHPATHLCLRSCWKIWRKK